jgi:hypothetical protein
MNSAYAEDIRKRLFLRRTNSVLKKRSQWTEMMAHRCRGILLSGAEKMKRGVPFNVWDGAMPPVWAGWNPAIS